ncbi:MAG: hypothetical protein P4L53_02555 [Candidatus Obscuribacterales bacterium]|nr:hypothetical protein [Candidatus Obscuribacterales bacterium]
MTAEEAAFVRSLPEATRPRILPIYAQTTEHPSALTGTAVDGETDAAAATASALVDYLGIPANGKVVIYADIEYNYKVSAAWLSGWINGVTSRGFIPGIYMAPLGPFGEGFCSLDVASQKSIVLWTAQHSIDGNKAGNNQYCQTEYLSTLPNEKLSPATLTCTGSTFEADIWQCCIGCFNNLYDVDIASDNAFSKMWAI